jgi:xylulokinase
MHPGILLGIDLGTSAVKVVAVTPQGEVVGRGSATYPIHWIREGWAEQDPEEWWRATAAATRDALTQYRRTMGSNAAHVAAVGLSGQVNGVVPLDRTGSAVRPAIIWLDRRAVDEAEHINHIANDLLQETKLSRASPIHVAAKLVWLLRHEAHLMRTVQFIAAPKDFLAYRMTGRPATDVTDAGASLLLDLRSRRWAQALLDRLQIPPELLPEVVESPTVVGRMRSDTGAALGIPGGTPVVAGAGDMAAITAGTGVIAPGLGCIMIGTAGQIALYMTGQPRSAPEGVWAMTAPIPGGYFWHGLVMTAGHCLSWFGDVIGESDIGELAEEAKASPLGSRGLVFLPFLDGAATPHADPLARAAFFGATSTHRRVDLVRSVMEGVAYNFREAFEAFAALGQRADRIRIGGGGSRSVTWQQILADVLETDLDVLAEQDASALGAAVIAAVGTNVHPDFETACGAMVRLQGSVEPDATRRNLYREYFAVYQQCYPRVRDLAHALSELARRGDV